MAARMILSNEEQQLGPLGCVRHSHGLVVLHLLSIVLLAGLLVTVLVQGFKDPSSSVNEKIYKQLMQLGVGVDSLCRPCPWEWTFFHRKCYYVSKSQRNWNDSVAACQEVDAQLVNVESEEEQAFLGVISKNKEPAWMGLSDLKQEGTWQWVDGSPLSDSFRKYWIKGEPNNQGNEDCAEFSDGGWNDNKCDSKKFWICKKLETSCSSK